jgi:hypothetical protein
MDISIFGYKLNVELLILIGVVYLILVGHTLCGCSKYSLIEGLDMMKDVATGKAVITTSVVGKTKEGFAGANTNYGESSSYEIGSDSPVNTSSWFQQDMTVVSGKPLSQGVKNFMARKQQTLPLKDGEMDFFANVDFKPECCPNTYSSSTGCACLSGQDYNYLITRGNNNVPYSEY